eukprot:TRINITY_DN1885_c0_g1_i4.p1 TRINITY_DN1885_c0_g1~~TRINITY_DN1885_c0_g1_i4.p1  ORF type:complete len:443 (+),score=95.58 TRINITY_DN1885_c0_g1_i4:265-1593(+)
MDAALKWDLSSFTPPPLLSSLCCSKYCVTIKKKKTVKCPFFRRAEGKKKKKKKKKKKQSSLAPTPEVRRSLAYGSPQSRYSSCEFERTPADFRFRASPMPQDPHTPLNQLADSSYRSILKLTNREGTSLSAEAGTLHRDIFNHLNVLDKQIHEVEKGIRDFKDSKELKDFDSGKIEQFQTVYSLQELAEVEPTAAVQAFGTGFGGLGGFNNAAASQQAPKKKGEKLKEDLEKLSRELQMRGDLEVWGGTRPGKGDKVRLRQVLTKRLKMERMLAVEKNYHIDASGAQSRAQRQRFIHRVRAISADGHTDHHRDDYEKVIVHCFASLLDTHYHGSRSTLNVDWSGANPVLRYTSSRCPGLLSLTIESTTYLGQTIYSVKHSDTDLGIDTAYYTNPGKSLYEALLFFLHIFDSKMTKQDLRTSRARQQTLFGTISRRVMLDKEY